MPHPGSSEALLPVRQLRRYRAPCISRAQTAFAQAANSVAAASPAVAGAVYGAAPWRTVALRAGLPLPWFALRSHPGRNARTTGPRHRDPAGESTIGFRSTASSPLNQRSFSAKSRTWLFPEKFDLTQSKFPKGMGAWVASLVSACGGEAVYATVSGWGGCLFSRVFGRVLRQRPPSRRCLRIIPSRGTGADDIVSDASRAT